VKCHEVDYEILGNDMQIVEVELDPQETVVAEAGAMNYMEDILSKLLNVGKRVLTGESIFMTHFTNHSGDKKRVAFASPFPGKIVAVDMKQVGGEILCQKDSFLAAALGTNISIALTKRLGTGFFGGEGFILQKLQGDGMVFIHACGHVIKKTLKNETLRLDTGCLVAFSPSLDYKIERAGNLKSMFFGGEGLFLATVQGTGDVWLQSLPFSRLADRIFDNMPKQGGSQGESSLLGNLTKNF
jgi:uncharacterized protein (TIGR00266 family)